MTAPRLIAFVLFALSLWAPAQGSGRKPLVFAVLTEDTQVELADGARWVMDKGDAFPVIQFREQQTKLVLQLAGTSFIVPARNARVLNEGEITEEMLSVYRRNVASYLDGKAKKWREAVSGQKAD